MVSEEKLLDNFLLAGVSTLKMLLTLIIFVYLLGVALQLLVLQL